MPRVALPRRFTFTTKQWLGAIVLLGAVLRFVPIWFGLPFDEARPDEGTAIGHAVGILDGDLNPHFFHWPSLTFYLFAGCFSIASRVHRLLTLNPVLSVNEQYLIGRAVVASAGTLTILVLFFLTRRIADDITALAASFFLAIATLHVRDSHFAMTDVLMTLVTASLALLLRVCEAVPTEGLRAPAMDGSRPPVSLPAPTSISDSAGRCSPPWQRTRGLMLRSAWRWHWRV